MSRWWSLRPTRSPSRSRRLPPARLATSSPRIARPLRSVRCSGRLMTALGSRRQPGRRPRQGRAAASGRRPCAAPAPRQRRAGRSPLAGVGRKNSPRPASMPRRSRSGKHGRVTKGDMLAAIEKAASAPAPVNQPAASVQVRAPSPADDAAREERVKMTRAAPDHRAPAERSTEHRCDAHDLQRGRHDPHHGDALAIQGRVREEARHQVGLYGLLHQGLRAGAEGHSGRQRRDRRHRLDLQELLPHRRAVGTDKGLVVPVVRDCDQKSIAEIEKASPITAGAPATASSRSTRCRAAPSPSPMAASTVR